MPAGARASSGPTMKDVAREAGVSKALVSIVFRGVPGASDATRDHVFATAERLGYRTNRAASLLARARTRQLGVVIDLHNAFQTDIVDAATSAADQAGYQILISPQTSSHDEERAITALLESRCEALLLIGPELDAARVADLTLGTPVVAIGRDLDGAQVDVVRTAEEAGMEQVVDHLVGLGHRRIAHVDGGSGQIGAARRAGFEQGVRRHRLLRRSTVVRGGRTESDGRRAAAELLRGGEPPSAIAAFNDHCALGVLEALSGAGLRVPDDVSVTGFDDTPLARLGIVDLTSVRQDAAELGRWAVRAAAERLDDGRTQRRESVLTPTLVLRGTSGPAVPGPGFSAAARG